MPRKDTAATVEDMSTQTEPRTTASGWAATGDLPWARQWDGMNEGPVLLPDGRVLAAGGGDNRGAVTYADAALYDPGSGQWAVTGSLATSRRLHSLTVLPDGKVLAAGGFHGHPSTSPNILTSAEIFDPATGTWSPTGSMHTARCNHHAIALADGRVLVMGGGSERPPIDSLVIAAAEIYDPATGTWTETAPMIHARAAFPAALLPDGRVLVAAGLVETGGDLVGLTFCEIYDPVAGTWSPTTPIGTSVPLETGRPRVGAQMVALADGTVLLTGGHTGGPQNWNYAPFSLGESERYDPATGKWTDAAAMRIPRDEFRLLRLDSGKVLAIGGLEYGGYDAGYQNSEIFDPATGQWGPLLGLTIGRAKFGAVKLADGRVLIAGGAAVLANAGPDGNHVLITKTDLFTP
ncbi:kelch domain-containing protein [Amycolatopsis keratiniphila]|uniref:Kelch domain-containing protein n=2 Tax=Amycolatopsis keratiniphila TaxID=129921 RepID=R4SLT2_9PSEU|nr:kelch domain-containing protein [Amycolatopsis keratiniphila]